MASSLFFSADEKLLLPPLFLAGTRAADRARRRRRRRCRLTVSTYHRAPMAAILSTIETLDAGYRPRVGVPRRSQLAPVRRCTHRAHCHVERVRASALVTWERCFRNSRVCVMVEEFEFICMCGPPSSPRTFVLIKGTSKLKVMICRNISVPALLSRSAPRGKWSHYAV